MYSDEILQSAGPRVPESLEGWGEAQGQNIRSFILVRWQHCLTYFDNALL